MSERVEVTEVAANVFELGRKSGRTECLSALVRAINESDDREYKLKILASLEVLDKDIFAIADRALNEA